MALTLHMALLRDTLISKITLGNMETNIKWDYWKLVILT